MRRFLVVGEAATAVILLFGACLLVHTLLKLDRVDRGYHAESVLTMMVSMLFGVQPLDPTTFAAVTIMVALTPAVSTVGSAWRAARIDPAVALRSE